MDLSYLQQGGVTLLIVVSIGVLISYLRCLHIKIRELTSHCVRLEEQVKNHPITCPLQQKFKEFEQQMSVSPLQKEPRPTTTDQIQQYVRCYYPQLIATISPCAREKLSHSDEQLCMMIKMGYNNKEIANILSITNSSVSTARYRLKQKLGLTSEQLLDEWIQNETD